MPVRYNISHSSFPSNKLTPIKGNENNSDTNCPKSHLTRLSPFTFCQAGPASSSPRSIWVCTSCRSLTLLSEYFNAFAGQTSSSLIFRLYCLYLQSPARASFRPRQTSVTPKTPPSWCITAVSCEPRFYCSASNLLDEFSSLDHRPGSSCPLHPLRHRTRKTYRMSNFLLGVFLLLGLSPSSSAPFPPAVSAACVTVGHSQDDLNKWLDSPEVNPSTSWSVETQVEEMASVLQRGHQRAIPTLSDPISTSSGPLSNSQLLSASIPESDNSSFSVSLTLSSPFAPSSTLPSASSIYTPPSTVVTAPVTSASFPNHVQPRAKPQEPPSSSSDPITASSSSSPSSSAVATSVPATTSISSTSASVPLTSTSVSQPSQASSPSSSSTSASVLSSSASITSSLTTSVSSTTSSSSTGLSSTVMSTSMTSSVTETQSSSSVGSSSQSITSQSQPGSTSSVSGTQPSISSVQSSALSGSSSLVPSSSSLSATASSTQDPPSGTVSSIQSPSSGSPSSATAPSSEDSTSSVPAQTTPAPSSTTGALSLPSSGSEGPLSPSPLSSLNGDTSSMGKSTLTSRPFPSIRTAAPHPSANTSYTPFSPTVRFSSSSITSLSLSSTPFTTDDSTSRPVLHPTSSLSGSHFSTVFTTVVITSTTTGASGAGVTTFTTVVASATLIPNGSNGSPNSFARSGGAIAGVAIGAIVFLILLTSVVYFAYRRHRSRRLDAEAVTASLGNQPSYGAAGGRARRPVLEDEDAEDGVLGTPEMGERLAGDSVVMPQSSLARMGVGAAAGGLYDNVNHGQGELSDSDDPMTSSGHMTGASGEGLMSGAVTDLATQGSESPGEQDALMDPMNHSLANLAALASRDLSAVPTSQSPAHSLHRASIAGIGPGEWIGGRSSSYADVGSQDPFDDLAAVGSSPDGADSSGISQDDLRRHGSMSSDGHLYVAEATGNQSGSGSSHGHQSGPGSSGHGHYGGPVLVSGQSSSSSHAGHDGRRSPGPSSLLPTQTQPEVPPSAYRSVPKDEDEEDVAASRKRLSFLNRSLKWRLRGGRPSDASNTVGSIPTTTTALAVPHSPRPPSESFAASIAAMGASETGTRFRSGSLPTIRPGSLIRSQSPILDSLPASMFSQLPPDTVLEHTLPPSVKAGLFGSSAMPSPALSEGSVDAPEGLLHPQLGLSRPGMQSRGQISFRDEMDYSRPIGGLVNNRQHSQTTVPSVYAHDSNDVTPARTSLESARGSVPTISFPVQENADAELAIVTQRFL